MARRSRGGVDDGNGTGDDLGIVVVPLDAWRGGVPDSVDRLERSAPSEPDDASDRPSRWRTVAGGVALLVFVAVVATSVAPWRSEPAAAPPGTQMPAPMPAPATSSTPPTSPASPASPASPPSPTDRRPPVGPAPGPFGAPFPEDADPGAPGGGDERASTVPIPDVWIATALPTGFVPVAFGAPGQVASADGELAIWAEPGASTGEGRWVAIAWDPHGAASNADIRPGPNATALRLVTTSDRTVLTWLDRSGVRTAVVRSGASGAPDIGTDGGTDGGASGGASGAAGLHVLTAHGVEEAAVLELAAGLRPGRAAVRDASRAAIADLPPRIALSRVPGDLHRASEHRTRSFVDYVATDLAATPGARITVTAARTMLGDLLLPRFTWLPWATTAGPAREVERAGRRFVVGEDVRSPGTHHVRWQEGPHTFTVSGQAGHEVLLEAAASVRTVDRMELAALARAAEALSRITFSDPTAAPPRFHRVAEGTTRAGDSWFVSVSPTTRSVLVGEHAAGRGASVVLPLPGGPSGAEVVERWSLQGVIVVVVLPAGDGASSFRVELDGQVAEAPLVEVDTGVLAGAALIEGDDLTGAAQVALLATSGAPVAPRGAQVA